MVCVISKSGMKLMPTTAYRARRLLKNGHAVIYKHNPFTIKLSEREKGDIQPIEYCCDTGYTHIGSSIKSAKHEYIHHQNDTLTDEVQHHLNQRRIRRTRRNHLRYRPARFDNRISSKKAGWLAPSIRNKKDIHIHLFRQMYEAMPITSATFEMGQFDTQVLKAVEENKPLPQGTDYQQGDRYGYLTLREAVFSTYNYTCMCCGRSIFKYPQMRLKLHHLGYLQGDRRNCVSNLGAVCEDCHTPANHKKGGRLYNLKPKNRNFKGATFMTMVRFQMFRELKEQFPDVHFHMTYGAETKYRREIYHVPKGHANDAYVMGDFHPKHRADFEFYKKTRRNDRCLQKFYDAQYIDSRDGAKKSGQQLSNGRTSRGHYAENMHIYRQKKVSAGHVNIRRQRTPLLPGTLLNYNGEVLVLKGLHNCKRVEFAIAAKDGRKSASLSKVTVIRPVFNTGWHKQQQTERSLVG